MTKPHPVISFLSRKPAAKALAAGLVLLALLVLAGYMLFHDLDVRPMTDTDEARHGINAYEMQKSGDYWVTTYLGEPDYWNLKPPMSSWSIVLGYQIFGFNALGMRAYSAFSMLLAMLAITLWLWRRKGFVAALFALLLLLGTHTIFDVHFARTGDADSQLFLLFTLSMLAMLDSTKNIRLLYVTAFCFGLAFLSKSWHAAPIPIICLVWLIVTGQIRSLRVKHYLGIIGFALLPLLPWAIIRYRADGFTFFVQMFLVDALTRSTTILETHQGDWLYYARYLKDILSLRITALLCGSLAVMRWRRLWPRLRFRKPSPLMWGLVIWFLMPIVLYSSVVSKLYWYFFPSLAPAMIAGGIAAGQLAKQGRLHILRLGVLCAATVFMAIGIAHNWQVVLNEEPNNTYQQDIVEAFDRDLHAGVHVYAQYDPDYLTKPENLTKWRQSDVLYAYLAGDVICLNGGQEAFEEDEESAYFMVPANCYDPELLEYYPVYYETKNTLIFEK